MELRPYEAADLEPYIWMCNHADPARPTTKAQVAHGDASFDPDAIRARFLVFEAGQLIGAVNLEPPRSNPIPHEVRLQLLLLSGFSDRAASLYDAAERAAITIGARHVQVSAQQGEWPLRVYEQRSFVEIDRMFDSNLDVTAFNPKRFAARASATLRVETLQGRCDDEAFLQRYYAATLEMLRDVPAAIPFVPWAYPLWRSRLLDDPYFLPDAHFTAFPEFLSHPRSRSVVRSTRDTLSVSTRIARHVCGKGLHKHGKCCIGFVGAEIAGVSQLYGSPRAGTLQIGLTGVVAAYRRRGIAFALKLEAIRHAKVRGFKVIRANNHVVNQPMLEINAALGFVPEPARVILRKAL